MEEAYNRTESQIYVRFRSVIHISDEVCGQYVRAKTKITRQKLICLVERLNNVLKPISIFIYVRCYKNDILRSLL